MHACKAPETAKELPLAETVTKTNIKYLIGGGGGSHQRTRLCFAFSLFCGKIQGNSSNSDGGRRLTSAFVVEIQSLTSQIP